MSAPSLQVAFNDWAPPSGFPITTDPEFPKPFRWEQIDGLVISPPPNETSKEFVARLARNLDLYSDAADAYSEQVEEFISQRNAKKAAEEERQRQEASKRKRKETLESKRGSKAAASPDTTQELPAVDTRLASQASQTF
jgi:hypothetical protein